MPYRGSGINSLIAMGGGGQQPEYNYLDSQAKAANALVAEQRLMDYPEDRQYLRETRSHEREMRPLKDEKEAIDFLTEISPMINWGNYGQSREHLIKVNKISENVLPDPQWFQQQADANGVPVDQFYNYWKQNSMTTLTQYAKQLEAKAKMVAATTDKSKTEEQLTRDALRQQLGREPTGQEILNAMQQRKLETARAMPAPTVYLGTTAEGQPLVTGGPKGNVNIRTPEVPGGGKIMPKPTKLPAEEQKSLQALSELASTTDEIEKMYPKIASKVGPIAGRWNTVKSKVISDPEFITFKNTISQLRTIVYGLSGKQINETEMEWLKNDILPSLESPGENFLAALKTFRDWAKRKHLGLNEQYTKSGYITGVDLPSKNKIGRFTVEVE